MLRIESVATGKGRNIMESLNMQGQFFSQNLGYMLLGLIAIGLLVQTYILVRIRNILHAMTLNFESLLYYTRKLVAPNNKQEKPHRQPAKACQFCKHRMAYINTGDVKEAGEDFYHRCGLRNVQVRLDDSCQEFEAEETNE